MNKRISYEIVLMIWLLGLFVSLFSQGMISTAKVDSLETEMRNNSFSYESQMKLINYYLSLGFKEAALLNYSFLKRRMTLEYDDLKVISELEYDLELIEKATIDLSNLYLLKPETDLSLRLAVLYATVEGMDKGLRILRRTVADKELKFDILRQLYVDMYNSEKMTLAEKCRELLWAYDPVIASRYFIKPELKIISPENNSDTNSNRASIVFQIKHEHPIRSIMVNDKEAFNMPSTVESVSRDFSHLVDLQEGENTFVVKVIDINGETQSDTLTINQFSFSRNMAWKSTYSDSLFSDFNRLRSYYPEAILSSEKNRNVLLCVIDADSRFKNDMLTFFDLLSSSYTGIAESNNAKLIYNHRTIDRNLKAYLGNSLLRQINFNTQLVLSMSGDWQISAESWLYKDINNEWTDVKPFLEDMLRYASGGVSLVLGGVSSNKAIIRNQLQNIIDRSVSPAKIYFVNDNVWKGNPLARINHNLLSDNNKRNNLKQINLTDLLDAETIKNDKYSENSIYIVNPYFAVSQKHNELYGRLQNKLNQSNVSNTDKSKILNFCSDWRRYTEMLNYVNNNWSINELIARVDDYQQRIRGE